MMRPRSRAKFIGLASAGAATEAGSPRAALRVLRIADLESVIDSTRPLTAGEPNLSRSRRAGGAVRLRAQMLVADGKQGRFVLLIAAGGGSLTSGETNRRECRRSVRAEARAERPVYGSLTGIFSGG